ncbi:MAG: hypothetical protein COA30_03405 [Sulfurimonas sp.]|nr:MAG: hypothetical protein COA30_03405 [Sulfurimonas sp.]
MKKITLASFVFMVMLVTGVSALIVSNGNENLTNTTEEKNSDKAKDDFSLAEEALSELEDESQSGSGICKAYAKVQLHCKAILEYDDDSSDKDDGSSDEESDDNVSDYQSKVQDIFNRADEAMKKAQERTKELNCEKEIECQKMEHRFKYQLHGDDDSGKLKYRARCNDDGSSDDGESN